MQRARGSPAHPRQGAAREHGLGFLPQGTVLLKLGLLLPTCLWESSPEQPSDDTTVWFKFLCQQSGHESLGEKMLLLLIAA